MNRSNRLSKNLTTIFGSKGRDECRVCKNPLGDRHPQRKYCSDKCQRVAYAVISLYRWEKVRQRVLERDYENCVNPECDETSQSASLEVDHIQPLHDAGAAHDPENLQTLCESCHHAKPAGTYDYRERPMTDGGVPEYAHDLADLHVDPDVTAYDVADITQSDDESNADHRRNL